jgi:quinolinate synthase
MAEQTPLDCDYLEMDKDTLIERIAARKAEFGDRLCILGHHYQRDEIVAFADHTGDSLKLSQLAANETTAEYIVFCGVHFMAESADILSGDHQTVCLPNMEAGCAMADMATDSAVRAALEELGALTDAKIVPISYVNSSAAIKAVTGQAGGACCTSSNVRRVFDWAFAEDGANADKILALPDEHLARNTAFAMGFTDEADCVVYDPALPDGGLTAEQVDRARFILWKGYCHVHQIFTVDDIERVRRETPTARVIVHPECPREVVAASDENGSTAQIIDAIAASQPGSKWVVGTEGHLVARLARKHPDKTITLLSTPRPAPCWQMGKVDLPHLLWVLDNLAEGRIVNQVRVPADVAAGAHLALERMISIPG